MQFKATFVALAAFAASAAAQTTLPPDVQQSVLLVLATALPPDQVSFAIASQSAFASQMASSLSAGNTPAWFQALPSDVKSLLPIIYAASAPAATSGTHSHSATPAPSGSASRTSATGSGSRAPSSSTSTNGAPYPTAAVGAGVGAALGFLGMLAL